MGSQGSIEDAPTGCDDQWIPRRAPLVLSTEEGVDVGGGEKHG